MTIYSAAFRCTAGCDGAYPIDTVIYRCPRCGDLLEVAHDMQALRERSAAEWRTLFDTRYKRTAWPYGSSVWGKKEWVAPTIRDENVVSMDEGGTNLFWAFNSLRVRHHGADFCSNRVRGIGKPDRVAVTLGHAPPIEAGEPRRFGRQVGWLAQDLIHGKEFLVLAHAFKKVLDTDFERSFSECRG
jgi:hypothetical protein